MEKGKGLRWEGGERGGMGGCGDECCREEMRESSVEESGEGRDARGPKISHRIFAKAVRART